MEELDILEETSQSVINNSYNNMGIINNAEHITSLGNEEQCKAFAEIEISARERFVPIILGDALDELISLMQKIKPKRILEIGTAIGYSGSIMLLNSPDCILDTVELFDKRRDEALVNFSKFGVLDRVNSYLGDAYELIPDMISGNEYDLVFLDGPKSKYGQYLDQIEDNIASGGYVFCDNVHFRGMVMNGKRPPHKFRTIIVGMRNFLERIQDTTRYQTTVMSKGDGIAIIKVVK